jgi:hypothetical protein
MESAGREVFEVRIADRLKQELAGLGYSPADDEELRVKDGAEARAALAEPVAELAERGKRTTVTGDDEVRDIVAGKLAYLGAAIGKSLSDSTGVGKVVREAKERSAGTVLFQAAVLATATGVTVGDESHVSQFSTSAEPAAEEAVFGHDGSTHSGSDRQHHHVADQPSGAEPELGPACGIRVVVDHDREVQPSGEPGLERLVPPADVRCVVDGRLGRIDETGGGDPDALDLFTNGELGDHGHNGVFDELRCCWRGHPGLAEDLSLFIDEGPGDFCSTDVNADCVHAEASSCDEGKGSDESDKDEPSQYRSV